MVSVKIFKPYQSDPHMYGAIAKKPVHKTTLGREHVGILLVFLLFLLLRRNRSARVLNWRIPAESSRMRWGNKFARVFQGFGYG